MDVTLELGTAGGSLVENLKMVRDQMNEIRKSSEQVAQSQKEGARAAVDASDEWIKKQNELLELQAKQTAEINAQKTSLKELRQKYDELKQASAGGLDAKAVKQYRDQIDQLKKEIADLKDQINGKNGKGKLQIFAEGSREEAVATVKRIKAELDTLNTSQLKGSYGKQLKAELIDAEKELDNLTKLSGQAAEKTGNVFNKAWGFLRQAAYLIPGLGIAGIIGLISEAIIDLGKELLKTSDLTKEFTAINVDSSKATIKEKVELEALVKVARDENASKEAKKNAIKGINDLMPEYNGAITQENINTAETNKRIDEYTKKLEAKARGQAYVAQIQAKYNELIEVENSKLEDNVKWYNSLVNFFKSFGNQVEAAALDNVTGFQNRQKRSEDLKSDIKTLTDSLEKELANGNARLDEEEKKATEKRLQQYKDRSDKIIALEKQLADLRIQAMQDGRDKEVAIENAKYDDIAKNAINKTKRYTEEISKIRSSDNISESDKLKEIKQLEDLIKLEYDVLEQGEISHKARLLAIDIKYYEDAQKALQESQDSINYVLLKGQEKEIYDLNKKYEKLLKGIADARKKALQTSVNEVTAYAINQYFDNQAKQLAEGQEKELYEIKKKYVLKRLKEEEDLKVAEAGLIKSKGANAIQLERIRQAAVLQVQIEFAEKRIELLSSSTDKEDQVTLAKLKATVEKLKLELKKLGSKSGNNKNIYQLLGLDLTQKEQRDLETAAKTITDSLFSIWGSYIQKRIDQSQELLNQLQTEIEAQQQKVDDEKKLKEQGLANDLEIEQSRLDDLKRRNNEQVAELKKAQKEQENYAKAQQVIQGIIAGTKLAASAAEYFASGSTYGPVVGLALSLAAIATMVATFASLKNETKQLTDFKTYRGGGEFDATGNYAKHESGGINIVDSRTGKKMAEFEQGEYAYFFKNGSEAKKYKPLFDTINSGRMSKWSVSPLGLQVQEQAFKTALRPQNSSPANGGYLAEINKNVKKIAAGKPEIEYIDGYRIERAGNHVRKIKLSNGQV